MIHPIALLLPLLSSVLASPLARATYEQGKLQSATSGLCLGSGKSSSGDAVALVECDSDKAFAWMSVPRGRRGAVSLGGNVLVVDGDLQDGAGVKSGVYDRYGADAPNGQDWYYTDDNHLAIYEGVHCLTAGDGNVLQIQPCGGNNQEWEFMPRD